MLIRDVKVTISYGDVTAETTIRAGARNRLRKELHDTIDRLGDQLGLAQSEPEGESQLTAEDRKLIEEIARKVSGASAAPYPAFDAAPTGGILTNTTKES